MEANGRIGGEPVPVGGPTASGLNPEEMNEIQSMMMAVGGFVEQPNNIQKQSDPYQQQQTMYQQPMAMGAQNGTLVSNPVADYRLSPTLGYNPTGSFSFEPQTQTSTSITDAAKKAAEEAEIQAGNTRCQAIGKVYNKETKLCEDDPNAQMQSSSEDDPSKPPETKPWYKSTDFTAGEAGGVASAAKYFSGAGSKAVSAIGGVIGGSVAGIAGAAAGTYAGKVSNLATARAEAVIRRAMGDTDGAEAIEAAITKQLTGSKTLAQADKMFNAVFGSDGDMKVIQALKNAGIQVDGSLRDKNLQDWLESNKTSIKNPLLVKYGSSTTPTPISDTTPKDDDGPSLSEKMMKKLQDDRGMTAADRAAVVKEGTGVTITGKQEPINVGIGAGPQGENVSGPMNKGGLMRKKKTKGK